QEKQVAGDRVRARRQYRLRDGCCRSRARRHSLRRRRRHDPARSGDASNAFFHRQEKAREAQSGVSNLVVHWTAPSLIDIQEAWVFIAEDNEAALTMYSIKSRKPRKC